MERTDNDHEYNTKGISRSTHPIRRACGVQSLAERTPGDGLRVVRLDLLTRPDVRALHIKQDFALRCDDDPHDDEVEQGTLRA